MNECNICLSSIHVFSTLYVFKFYEIQFQIQIEKQIQKSFFNLETVNVGGHLIATTSVKCLTEAVGFIKSPRLNY
jgi:hypothetical protein